MLHVRIDIVPGGLEYARSTLVDVYVANDGTGTHEVGHYDVYTQDPRGREYPREDRPGWVGKIRNFPRKRDQAHASALIACALNMVVTRASGEHNTDLAAETAKTRPHGYKS